MYREIQKCHIFVFAQLPPNPEQPALPAERTQGCRGGGCWTQKLVVQKTECVLWETFIQYNMQTVFQLLAKNGTIQRNSSRKPESILCEYLLFIYVVVSVGGVFARRSSAGQAGRTQHSAPGTNAPSPAAGRRRGRCGWPGALKS